MFTIRKTAVLVSLLAACLAAGTARLSAADNGVIQNEVGRRPAAYAFSVSPFLGLLYGRGEEILYNIPAAASEYASELLWDLKPLLYVGFGAEFGPADPFARHGFIAAAGVKFGLPLKTGVIEDRDWTNDSEDYVTLYSRHDARALNAVIADASAGFSWRLADFLALSAYGEFTYMLFSWAAEDGYIQYPDVKDAPWDAGIEKEYQNGVGIRYRQNWFIFAPGLSLKCGLTRRFSVEGAFSYSPLIYCLAMDDHSYSDRLKSGMIFSDYLSFGHYVKGGLKFVYAPFGNVEFSLSLFYRRIKGSRGDSYMEYSGPAADADFSQNLYDGGAGHSALDLGLSAKIRVGG